MKCHAGVEFASGKACPKCNAKLGDVCWPGINADLLKLAQLRKALEGIQTMAECALVGPKRDQESNLASIATCARAALSVPKEALPTFDGTITIKNAVEINGVMVEPGTYALSNGDRK